MAKKSFKNNPALQFITMQEEPEEPARAAPAVESAEIKVPAEKEPPKSKAPAAVAAPKAPEAKKTAVEDAVKRQNRGQKGSGTGKTAANSENLAAEGGLPEKASSVPPTAKSAPEAKIRLQENVQNGMEVSPGVTGRQSPPMKLNPMYIETRSKRVQLLMQPTLHDRLRQLAGARGQSLNDLVHEALERFAEHGGEAGQ